MEVWSANTNVLTLETFVKSEIERLKVKPKNPRSIRQIKDGENFLNLLHTMRYCEAKKLTELRNLICKRRTELKEYITDLKTQLPGQQLSLFDEKEPLSEENMEITKLYVESMENEIKWLHKALGICSNKEYFK